MPPKYHVSLATYLSLHLLQALGCILVLLNNVLVVFCAGVDVYFNLRL